MQLVLRQAIALEFDSKNKTQEIRITAIIVYVHLQKAKLEPIIRTITFEVIMRMGEIGAGTLVGES